MGRNKFIKWLEYANTSSISQDKRYITSNFALKDIKKLREPGNLNV